MELDDLKSQWRESNGPAIRVNTALLLQSRSALQSEQRHIVFELLMNFAVLILLGLFLAKAWREPVPLACGLALHLCSVLLTAAGVRELAILRSIDLAEPIVDIQKKLETVRRQRIRTVQAIALLSPFLWTPLVVTVLYALGGVNVYQTPMAPWLTGNLLFGIAWIPAAILIAKGLSAKFQGRGWFDRIVNSLAGSRLNASKDFLARLGRFEQGIPGV